VKVRLSVEGTPEALAAFRSVQAQAQASGRASGKAFAPLAGALSGIKGLLAGAAAAFSAGALMSFGKATLDNIEKLGRLADELGTTVEHMSGLSVAANLADADVETLSGTMGKLTKSVDDLRNGSPAATVAFARLGLTAKDFPGEDTARWYETVAIRLSKLADGGSKSAAAMALMGKNGRAALPIMKQIIDLGGLQGVEAKAQAMGVFVDATTLALVRQLGDSMKILKMEATGVAIEFFKGFGPSAVAALQSLMQAVNPGGTSAFRAMASAVGWCLRAVVGLSEMGFAVLNSKLEATKATLIALRAASELITRGKFAQAGVVLDALKNIYAELDRSEHESIANAWRLMATKLPDLPAVSGAGARAAVPPEDDAAARARADAAASARLAREREAIEAELKLTLDGYRAQEEAAKQAYERGHASLADYYATRREVAEKGLAAEVAALDKEWELASKEKDPAKRASQQDEIAGRARAAGFEIEAQLAKITAEQMEAIEGLSTEALKYQKSLLEAQGKTHEARMLDLAIELKAYRDFLVQSGYDAASIDAQVAARRNALVSADQQGTQLTQTGQTFANTLSSWLGSSINQVNSLSDAFRSLALAILQAVQQMLAAKAAQWIVSSIPGMTTPTAKARGGLIRGPGSATSDSIFALLSNGEYVVRAFAVAQPGVLAHLEAINRGVVPRPTAPVDTYRSMAIRQFSEGGLANARPMASASSGGVNLAGGATIELSEGLIARHVDTYLQSSEGQRTQIRVISKNRRAIGSALR
jgi:hypothetical protein